MAGDPGRVEPRRAAREVRSFVQADRPLGGQSTVPLAPLPVEEHERGPWGRPQIAQAQAFDRRHPEGAAVHGEATGAACARPSGATVARTP